SLSIGEISDGDDDALHIEAVATPAGPDWWRYRGDDDAFSFVDPGRLIEAHASLRLCNFAECEDGLANTEYPCPPTQPTVTSDQGRPGCCMVGGTGFEVPDANGTGVVEDNMQIFIRIDEPSEACIPYTLTVHY